jgi:DNA repair protein SbcC/Rad50
MLRYDKLKGRDMGNLKGDFEVDFSSIPGPLIAVVGETGAGKSTLLELLQGAHERKCPTRGALSELATSRQSYIEATVVNGRSYIVRQVIDGVTGRGESFVADEAGEPLLKSAKVRSFDEWRERALPPLPILLASTFAPQERRGILSYTDGEIKALLLRVAGSEHLEALAKSARDRARETRGALEKVEQRIADASAGAVSVEDAVKTVAEHETAIASLTDELATARAILAERETEAARIASLEAEDQARLKQRQEVQTALLAARGRVVDLENRISNNRRVLLDAAAIRAAKARADELDASLAGLRENLAAARVKAEATAEALSRVSLESSAAEEMLSLARENARQAEARAKLLAQARADASVLPAAREALAACEQAIAETDETIQRLNEIASHGAQTRIGSLRDGLTYYADGSQDCGMTAASALAFDDEQEAASAAAPAEAKAAHDRRSQLVADRGRLSREVERLARQKAIVDASAPEPDHAAIIARADQAHAEAVEAARAAAAEDDSVRRLVVSLSVRINEATAERNALAPKIAMVDHLATCEARIAELEPQLVEARDNAGALSGQLDLMSQPRVLPSMPDVETARANVAHAERDLAVAEAAVSLAKKAVEEAREREGKIAKFTAERQLLAEDLADWLRLGDDLGRDGLQAMLVDDAGATWMINANDLLHNCIGTRWTVSLETQRLDADGKKTLEDTQIRALDTERGRDAEGKTLSGGERAIVNEALSLGLIGVFGHEADGCTLVRDETSAPLSEEYARGYVEMLRRAAAMVNASRVIVASHSEIVKAAADSRVEVVDGQVRVAA